MKIHRFFFAFDKRNESFSIDDKALVHQIKNVLKLKPGEKIILCNNQNGECLASIVSLLKNEVVCLAEKYYEVSTEPTMEVTLYCALLKKENFEWVVQKAVEVGVHAIVPVLSARTVKQNLKLERLHIIAKEAAEQSGRGVIPNLSSPLSFMNAVGQAVARNELNVLFDKDGAQLKKCTFKKTVGIFIGPEGGWDESELKEAKNKNFEIASLGPLTLRAETAAVVGSFLVLRGF